ncbi:hypothetical protein [Salinimicrobium flavum]|uniref:DUF3857 domain-containing protein n=1 Tax=Salinimicrobium flavum TaxID=1737065 RepID=A0ABW5IUB8_9FLAO
MIKFLLLPFLLIFSAAFSQQSFNTSNSNVALKELLATSYEKDTTANAFFIFEDGYSRFESEGDYDLLTNYTAKIKVLNKEGFDQANISIRLFKGETGKEKISELKAITYYLEDGVIKEHHLSPDKVYTEENEKYDLVKFTFPSVTPGAILVYSYQKASPFIFNFEPWWFQADVPKVYSRYLAEIPGNFKYHIRMVGDLKLHSEKNDIKRRCFSVRGVAAMADCARSEYVMTDIPAFKEEKYLTSRYNYISRLEYELNEMVRTDGHKRKYTKTWDDVDKEFKTDNDLGKQLRKTKWVRGVLPENISSMPNNLEKAEKIFDFVKDNYRWDGKFLQNVDVNIKDLLEEKTGNVSAMNILLHNLYEEEGFEVLPVLSSTRSNGMPTKLYPVLSEFNYLMVQLDLEGKKYFLDATEKNTYFGLPPFRALNRYGRLLDFSNGSSWVDLEPEGFSSVSMRDSIKLNTDGTAIGVSNHVFSGYNALSVKNRLDDLKQEDIFNDLTNPNSHTRSLSATPNVENNPVEINFNLHNGSQKINDLIYLNPFSFKFYDENPFKMRERTYPIDFGYKHAYTYNIHLEIPEDHEFVELPENKILKLPDNGGTLYFMTQQVDERTVNIHCRVSFPITLYSSGFYPYLQQFFTEMLDIQEKSIILVRQKV